MRYLRRQERHSLLDGVTIRDVAAGHGLEYELVLLGQQTAVGVEWGGRVPDGRGVDPLQPRMALYIGERRPLGRIPLEHTRNQTERKMKTGDLSGLTLSQF